MSQSTATPEKDRASASVEATKVEGALPIPAALLAAQTLLANAVRHPRSMSAGDVEFGPALQRVVSGNDRLSPLEQTEVYREQFWLRHVASLREDFPSLAAATVLGEEGFQRMAERYLTAFPPSDFMLRNLAAKMTAFLETDPRYAVDPLLADLARVEWAFIDAYDAADPLPFDPAPLASAGEDALFSCRLEMQPPLRLVALAFPAHEFREAVRSGGAPERPDPREVRLAIFRRGLELQSIEIEPAAFEVVRALQNGEALGEACDRAIASGISEEEISAKLGAWFQWWTQWGWLSKVVLPAPQTQQE